MAVKMMINGKTYPLCTCSIPGVYIVDGPNKLDVEYCEKATPVTGDRSGLDSKALKDPG